MKIIIQKVKQLTSDESFIFDATISIGDNVLKFNCVDEKDTDEFIEKLANLIEDYTVEDLLVV